MKPSAHPHYLDPVHNACLIAFRWDYDPANVYVMYWAFYDASGSQTDRSGPLVVAGVVATVDKWREFEPEWQAVLDDFAVPHFHMKDFAPGSRAFESWKHDKPRRAEFCRRLIAVIKQNTNKIFMRGLMMEDFHCVNERYTLSEAYAHGGTKDAGAYTLLTAQCLDAVVNWVGERKGWDNQLMHIVEAGDPGSKALQALLGRSYPVFFSPKIDASLGRRVRFLEAADFIGWEFRRVLRDRHSYESVEDMPFRKSVLEIHKQLQYDDGWIPRHELERICRTNPLVLERTDQGLSCS